MKTSLVAIGNSKGVRLPKVMLKESGITKDVDIKVVRGGLRITPVSPKSVSDTAVLSESTLAKDWSKPEEDEAWADL